MQVFLHQFGINLIVERLVFVLFLLKNVKKMQIFPRLWRHTDIELRQPQQNLLR